MAQGKEFTDEQRNRMVQSLKPYLLLGYSVKKACINASITYTTIRNWMTHDESLCMEIASWQNMVSAKARENWVKRINAGDYTASKDWLERVERDDFSTRTEHTGKDGEPLFADEEDRQKTKKTIIEVTELFLAKVKAKEAKEKQEGNNA